VPDFGGECTTHGIKRIIAEPTRGKADVEERAGSNRSVRHAFLRLEGFALGFVERYPHGKNK
jgi:hypothetical protein